MESNDNKSDWIIGIALGILFLALFCVTVFSSFIGHPIFGG